MINLEEYFRKATEEEREAVRKVDMEIINELLQADKPKDWKGPWPPTNTQKSSSN